MLYINMEINNVKLQAFVDTGAQSTIISLKFAQRAGLMNEIDTRFKGVAVGVGTSRIVGRIHACKLKLDNNHEITCALQVLDNIDIDLLLGIDMLKKHRCLIDLVNNVLKFTEARVDVPFIKDHQIKRNGVVLQSNQNTSSALGGLGNFGNFSLVGGPEPNQQEKERRIKSLQDLGASRSQAVKLLERFGWNAELAAGVYFDANNM